MLQLTFEQQHLQDEKTKARDGKEWIVPVTYLDLYLVPVGLGLMADAVQQLVQAQIVVIQIWAILHGRLADLCGVH